MCGIAGVINLDNQPIDFNYLKKMSDVQRHRGPDDQGFVGFSFKSQSISSLSIPFNSIDNTSFHGGIGFNRLSILDVSLNGHQPMISENGKVIIAYNGEMYNAFHFKDKLKNRGYHFRSKSDTEIVLNLYLEFGINKLLELMNGMYAFCIVDIQLQKIFLARDHVGIKPMYWYKKSKTVLFASEIKAFRFHHDFQAQINEEHVDEYLFYKYCAHNRTLFQGVSQIPPGYFLEISFKGERLIKYWEPDLTHNIFFNKKNALDKIDLVLKESVKSQLLSDVKIGCQLSGGIDSSLITTYAQNFFKTKMETFSIILENENYSEEKYIDQVIEKTKVDAHKFILTPKYFFDNIIMATWHIDVPLPIPQAVGIKRLAQGSSDYVTVLLSGEGSDELMGGYTQIYNLAYKGKNQHTISIFSKIPGKGGKIYNQYLPQFSVDDYFIRHRTAFHLNDFIAFRPKARFEEIFEQRKQLFPNHTDILKSTRVYELRGWLVNVLNIQDKMTMAHSIENRVPFLDRNFINFVFSLPSEYFIHSNKNPFKYNSPNKFTKILLKKLAARYYNSDFVYRTKMGFNQPLSDYFDYPDMQEFINENILPGIKKRGIFNYVILDNIWMMMTKNKNYSGMSLFWMCMSFELWAQIFIDNKYI